MRSLKLITLVLVVGMLLSAVPAGAAVIEKIEEDGVEIGLINWTMGLMKVEGIGSAEAEDSEQAALDDAYGKLMKLVARLRVSSEKKVEDFTAEDEELEEEIGKIVSEKMVTKIDELSDGSVKVIAHLLLYGPKGPCEAIYRTLAKEEAPNG